MSGLSLIEELESVDGPAETQPARVPSLDQQVPVADYVDWRPENTRIVTCRIANEVYPGERYESRDEAIAAVTAEHGRILEANYTPGRAFFRVYRKAK